MAISVSVHNPPFLEDRDELERVNGVSWRECPAVLTILSAGLDQTQWIKLSLTRIHHSNKLQGGLFTTSVPHSLSCLLSQCHTQTLPDSLITLKPLNGVWAFASENHVINNLIILMSHAFPTEHYLKYIQIIMNVMKIWFIYLKLHTDLLNTCFFYNG